MLGKKIFFLHPAALIQNYVVSGLVQEEFEVYVVKNETKFRYMLEKYPDSIIFASINEAMKESAWEELIKDIQKNPKTAGTHIGIIAAVNDDAVRRKYTEQLKVTCGFTVVKSDHNEPLKQLIDILGKVNAKGRRKYIRLIMDGATNATVNLPMNGTFVNGVIKDISAVGFSCVFAADPGLRKNNLYKDIQLRLQSQLVKAEGIVFGSRMDGNDLVYVILFSQRIDPDVPSKIRKYIQSSLQSKIEQEFD